MPAPETDLQGRPVATAAAALGLAVAVLQATSVTVQEIAVVQVTPEERFAGALEARQLAPWRSGPLDEIAVAALETGEPGKIAEASAILEKSRWLRPRSASLADLRSHLAQALGRGPSAAAEAWAAQRAHPESTVYRLRMEQLISRLQGEGLGDDR
jgi:hypothetical protein